MMLAAVAVQTRAGGRRSSDRPRVGVIAKDRSREPGLPEGTVADPVGHFLGDPVAGPRVSGSGRTPIAEVWDDHHLKPWKVDTFKVSNNPPSASIKPAARRSPAPPVPIFGGHSTNWGFHMLRYPSRMMGWTLGCGA